MFFLMQIEVDGVFGCFFLIGLFFVDVEFDDGVSSNRCRSGGHLRKVDSYVRIQKYRARFRKGER